MINPEYTKPLKNIKIIIGTEEVHKFSFIVDYWDEEIVGKVADILHENHAFSLRSSLKWKGLLES